MVRSKKEDCLIFSAASQFGNRSISLNSIRRRQRCACINALIHAFLNAGFSFCGKEAGAPMIVSRSRRMNRVLVPISEPRLRFVAAIDT